MREESRLFGVLLRRARKAKGVTRAQLAAHLDMSVPYLADVEAGRRSPFVRSVIERIALFLQVDSADLLDAAAVTIGHVLVPADHPVARRLALALARGERDTDVIRALASAVCETLRDQTGGGRE